VVAVWMSVISCCVERAKKAVVGVEKVPIQSIDFTRYSSWLTCGMDLWDPLRSKHLLAGLPVLGATFSFRCSTTRTLPSGLHRAHGRAKVRLLPRVAMGALAMHDAVGATRRCRRAGATGGP